jgi:hypothetical protein
MDTEHFTLTSLAVTEANLRATDHVERHVISFATVALNAIFPKLSHADSHFPRSRSDRRSFELL